MAHVVKWVFVASLLTWALGGFWIMTSGGAVTFDMITARPVIIHHLAGGLTLGLGIILSIHWLWIKLYS
jgi:hypothetical protein